MSQRTILTKTLSMAFVATAFLVSVSCSSRKEVSDTNTATVETASSPYASDSDFATGSDYNEVADLGTGSSGRSR